MIKYSKKEVLKTSLFNWEGKPTGLQKEAIKECLKYSIPVMEKWIEKVNLDKNFKVEVYRVSKFRIHKKDNFRPYTIFFIFYKNIRGQFIIDYDGNIRQLFGNSKRPIKTKKTLISIMSGVYSLAYNSIERY